MGSTTNTATSNIPKEKVLDIADGTGISRAARVGTKINQINVPTNHSSSNLCEVNPAWPFKSSETNYEIAKEEYNKSPVEKYVATAFGDELPAMRNELIERKHSGEGFVERHVHAWTHLENWKVDPDNERREKSDPIVCKKEDGDIEKKVAP